MSEMERTSREPSLAIESPRNSYECNSPERPPTPPTDGVLPSSLPYPDFDSLKNAYDGKRKSHARKQPAGHVPRPKNAFILFRCDFVRQRKVPDHVEANHRNISRIVGTVWRQMSEKQKAPWIEMADIEKKNHTRAFPGYKYHPGSDARGGIQKGKKKATTFMPVDDEDTKPLFSSLWALTPPLTPPPNQYSMVPHRRSSSCPPPGAVPVVPASSLETMHLDVHERSLPLMTRDDLSRRPSCTIMYHSIPLPPSPAQSPVTTAAPNSEQVNWMFPWMTDPNCGPPLTSGPYRIAPPIDAPGWDAPPPRPTPLYSYDDGTSDGLFTMGTNELNDAYTNEVANWDRFSHHVQEPIQFPFTNPFEEGSIVTKSNSWSYNPSPLEPAHVDSTDTSTSGGMRIDLENQSFFPHAHDTHSFDHSVSNASPTPQDTSANYAYSTINAVDTPMHMALNQQAHAHAHFDPLQELGALFPRLSLEESHSNNSGCTDNEGPSAFSDGEGSSSRTGHYQHRTTTLMHCYPEDPSSSSGSGCYDGYHARMATMFPKENPYFRSGSAHMM